MALNSEYELNTIIQSGMISESERVNFYNFKRRCRISETEGLMLNKFVLLDSMQGFCPSNRSNCKIYTQRHSSAIFEITFDYLANRTIWINPFVFGWAIVYKNYENAKNCFYVNIIRKIAIQIKGYVVYIKRKALKNIVNLIRL